MTPQAAVGAGIGGLAAAGAGGTAVAYAAGAFKGTENKKNNDQEPTYLFQALKLDPNNTKEYIGKNESDKIKNLLGVDQTPKYSDTLKESWDKMIDDTPGTTLNRPNTGKDELFKLTEDSKNQISTYTSKWCEHIAKKPLSTVPTSEGKDKNTWEAFNKACFWTKAGG
ncbi:hypothetical protein [Candidatus Mycoplasma haematohominis]|uniref:Uncharacterized protein n=1 Tax=Candidatus Mycoplasma haematohominis TaxID=1494318 RepID=A0A478FPU3_9MOLU|nr:hypothetical protein [Candidatus Mycoplasma haemohominis]GCE63067.1 hypothetical protein MHSWG343_00450 [Candidatus Mycoplasma haemohominis]